MEVPVAHHLGAAQDICVERIRPVHILNRQSKVLKTEDTLPERCVVACCDSYYSFSTGTDEICAHQGEIAAQPTSLMKSRRLNRDQLRAGPCRLAVVINRRAGFPVHVRRRATDSFAF